jgi:hypothetical protein
MNVSFTLGALAKTKWYEYLARFAFGGAITVTARFLAEHFGPVGGTLPGLSRYFSRKRHAGRKTRNPEETECGNRNQLARTSSRCGGRSRSGIGKRWLAAFALTVWKFFPYYNSAFVFLAAKRFGSRWPSPLGAFGENTVAVSHFS